MRDRPSTSSSILLISAQCSSLANLRDGVGRLFTTVCVLKAMLRNVENYFVMVLFRSWECCDGARWRHCVAHCEVLDPFNPAIDVGSLRTTIYRLLQPGSG